MPGGKKAKIKKLKSAIRKLQGAAYSLAAGRQVRHIGSSRVE